MENLSESYVVISRLWHCYSECNSVTQNTAVPCANGTARTRRIILYINCGLNEKKCRQSSSCSSRENLSATLAHKVGLQEKLCERYG